MRRISYRLFFRMKCFSKGSSIHFCQQVIWISVFCLCISVVHLKKFRYASNTDCDRYSQDALYHEKFKVITENIFKDNVEFVNKIADEVADSLTTTMAGLPNKDSSDNEDRKVHTQFKSIKSAFASKLKKIQKNITAKWDDLLACKFDLLYDNGKTSIFEYLNKTLNMSDAYQEARQTLDSTMGSFISFVKAIVRDGLQGISLAAEDALKREDEAKKKAAEEKEKDGKKEDGEENFEKDEKKSEKEETEKKAGDKLTEKKLEIVEMVVSGFLRNITIEVIKQKIDLSQKVSTKPEDRDSPLDDMLFDILMIKNRMLALIHNDIPKEKGSIDLARRSVYSYFADQAEVMYKEKIKSKQTTQPGGEEYYKKLWSNESELMDTCLSLMNMYP